MKFLKNKLHLIEKVLLLLILLCTFIFISAYSYVSAVSSDISDSVFRLHVIANSDSDEDQNLKYKVRDALIEYMNTLTININSKEDAMNIANDHISDFYNIANKVVAEYGYNYPINITIGKHDFPTKKYGDITLPAGIYDALRVEIGQAAGHNWWCVMFPPLCFVDVTSGIVPDDSKELLQDSLSTEEYDLITSNESSNNNVEFKFKIIEFVENFKIALKTN